MKRLVLLGGGHAQVQVIKAFGADPPPETAVVLINRNKLTPYSGMLPGLISGHYNRAESHIDLARLCARAHIAFIEQEAVALDLDRGEVRCADGRSESYDILSVDTGSTPPLDPVPGAREHALPVKPIESFLAQTAAMTEHCALPGAHSVVLVGGGAAGFEVMLALAHRIASKTSRGAAVAYHWVTDTPQVLPTFPPRVRERGLRIMDQWRVRVHTDARVHRVTARAVELSDGRQIEATHVVWATGAQPASMFAQAGLRTDAHGFIAVDAGLRSLSHPNVFASGDVAGVIEHPRPKAGVFAVRQGPALTRNLRLALAGREPQPFIPQQRFLVILSAGKRYAIATRGRLTVQGRWVWVWKDRIDRRFVQQFS